MSRVTRAMKAQVPHRRRSARVLRERAIRGSFGMGTLYLNGVRLGVVTQVTYDLGPAWQELPMTFEPVRGEFSGKPAGSGSPNGAGGSA